MRRSHFLPLMGTLFMVGLLGPLPEKYSGVLAAESTSPSSHKPLRVIIRPRSQSTSAQDAAALYQNTAKKVETFVSSPQWDNSLDNSFFSGLEDPKFIENYTTEASEDRFYGLNKTLASYGDKKLALAKVEFKGHRLYDQVSRNIITPMYHLQTGDGSGNPTFFSYSRIGQNWLLMNMQTIGVYNEKMNRRPIASMLTTAPKHFNFNESYKKSLIIMKEKSSKKSTIHPQAPN